MKENYCQEILKKNIQALGRKICEYFMFGDFLSHSILLEPIENSSVDSLHFWTWYIDGLLHFLALMPLFQRKKITYMWV